MEEVDYKCPQGATLLQRIIRALHFYSIAVSYHSEYTAPIVSHNDSTHSFQNRCGWTPGLIFTRDSMAGMMKAKDEFAFAEPT